MIYAATEPGVEELRRLIQRVRDCVQEVEEASRAVENTADGHRSTLGPHYAELEEALQEIRAALTQASGPAEDAAQQLERIAKKYEAIIAKKLIRSGGRGKSRPRPKAARSDRDHSPARMRRAGPPERSMLTVTACVGVSGASRTRRPRTFIRRRFKTYKTTITRGWANALGSTTAFCAQKSR